MAGITIRGLSKNFGANAEVAAVSDITLDIADNSFVTLLGPSGCGKTTTLRLIAGYIVPDEGTIEVDGRTVSSASALPLIRPGLFAGWLLVFVPVIQELSASILLFSSSSITLAVAVYNLYETGYIEPVAALAMVNMAIIGVAIWLAYRIGGRSVSSREAAPVSN